jgi:hypothetical protein
MATLYRERDTDPSPSEALEGGGEVEPCSSQQERRIGNYEKIVLVIASSVDFSIKQK